MELNNTLAVEHTVIASNQPYEKVLEALKARMGSIEGWAASLQNRASGEAEKVIEARDIPF